MDEKTLAALTALAQKLGTTAEYLWGVLVMQAPIQASVNLAVQAAWVVVCLMLVRYVKRKTGGAKPEWSDEFARIFAWAGLSIVCVISAAVILSQIADNVSAILNPEYWALRQIFR